MDGPYAYDVDALRRSWDLAFLHWVIRTKPCMLQPCIHALPVPVTTLTVLSFSRELHYGWGAYNAAWKCNGSWKTDRDSEQPCSESRKRLSCGESISMPRCTSLLSLFGISPNDVITFHFLLSLNSNRFIFQSRLMKESTFYRNILHHYFILCQPTRNYWCSWI